MEYKQGEVGDSISDASLPTTVSGGVPVYYAGKIYLTMKELCDEIGEDNLVVSQMLNPNSPRKVAPHLAANGLRYATDDEIKAYYQSSHT